MAFRLQRAVVGLQLASAVDTVAGALYFHSLLGDEWLFYRLTVGALTIAHAGVLATAAARLRRGSRSAYRVSLAGLGIPLLTALLAIFGIGTVGVLTGSSGDDSVDLEAQFAFWLSLSNLLNLAVTVTVLTFCSIAIGLLMSRTCRRFYTTVAR